MNNEFKIVEYDPSYAAAVAGMWTRSGDSWGGFNNDFTPESVRVEEEASVHVNLYLALIGEEVVGYCKIAKWTQDEGALYIGTLNVRPDLHGKKIGKALVLKSVERTVELGWGRLDLHTWPGNTKAVPLYKKTGFFWEERDKEVYCVNYIPSVLKNPLVSDFFDRVDWYEDSTREIKVAPDGRVDNEFTYFTYSWEKGGRHLEMEYERSGRGLSRVLTDNFEVKLTVEKRELVFGREYEATFSFQNLSEEAIDIEIHGEDDRNIEFAFSHAATVDTSLVVTGSFIVGAIEKDQSDWKTHPRVCANVSINGKSAAFAVGVVPKFPATIRFCEPDPPIQRGKPQTGYLDVVSNMSEKADFTFELENSRDVRFEKTEIRCPLHPGERKSIEVPITVFGASVYSSGVKASASLPKGDELSFEREITGAFPFPSEYYSGEIIENKSDRSAVVGIGPVRARLNIECDSRLNGVYVEREGYQSAVRFMSFQLGKPYDDEFTRISPVSIESVQRDHGIQLNARYVTTGYPGLEMFMHIRVEHSGMVKRWFSFRNDGSSPLSKELFLLERVRCDMEDTVLPYNGQILETRTETQGEFWYWAGEGLTGNWLFSGRRKETIGICWDPHVTVNSGEWFLLIEHNLGRLGPGELAVSPVITAAVGVFSEWNECREYALDRAAAPRPVEESLEISVNGHNPFVSGSYSVEVIEHKQMFLDGAIGVSRRGMPDSVESKTFVQRDSVKSARFDCSAGKAANIEIVDVDLDLIPVGYNRSRALFPMRESGVTMETGRRDGFDVTTLSNGIITLSGAPDYSPGLISCEYNGEEWLDSGFPKLGPRDWWNPWIGGCVLFPSDLEATPLLREPARVKSVEKYDSKGNRWSGLMVSIDFKKHNELRGLGLDHYFMLLPGVPVLLVQSMIRQDTGSHFRHWELTGNLCLKGSGTTSDTLLEFLNQQNQRARLNSGHEELEIHTESPIAVRDKGRAGSLILYSDPARTRLQAVTQKNSTMICTYDKITAANGEKKSAPPKFLVFSDIWLDQELLGDLRYIDLFETAT